MYLAYIAACSVISFMLYRRFLAGAKCLNKERLDGKTVIVTGANTGIGKETARELVRRGARVILACRDTAKGCEAAADIQNDPSSTGKVKVMQLNLASLKSIRQFVNEFNKDENQLHILVNNAGVMFVPYSETEDSFEMTMGVNHLGHFLLTNLLLDVLKRSQPSRVVTVSSLQYKTGNIDINDLSMKTSFNRFFAYGNSKLANILFSRELARRLQGSGVTTYSLHPGVVRTELRRHVLPVPLLGPAARYVFSLFTVTPVQGSQTTVYCCTDPDLANSSGKYYSDCCETKVSPKAEDDEVAQKLWSLSEQLVGLSSSSL